MTSQEIRQSFIDFFKTKEHTIVSSSPIVSKNDPTLMFANSGMTQFKDYFLGHALAKNKRVADTQKCLRVSGKHNDLEEVGYDTYHHTMFEMLGNWSFGDYFKEEAIAWAWELITKVYKVDKSRLYVTVFEGDSNENLPEDAEAYALWKKHIAQDRIIKGNKKDNFWEMGEQGPCGPCSEIHIDIRSDEERAKVDGKSLVNTDHPQVVEIWNLVFMEFNRRANGKLENLPNKHVDTGMGFERLCMALQNVKSSYDTDVFQPLIREIETITGIAYGQNTKTDIAIRVVADHVRAVAFAIADGQLPSNTGAGYVIRRVLRRAIRYYFTFLDKKEPLIYRLVDVLTTHMSDVFPEIKVQKNLVKNVIREEEQTFLKTLEQGLVLLDALVNAASDKKISGAKAFELYDTYGFPIDLTTLILKEKGYTVDTQEFEAELQKQKERSRKASVSTKGDWHVLLKDGLQEFVGYDILATPVKIVRYRKVTTSKDGSLYHLVLNITPFYAESGGQVGDKGYLESPSGGVTYIIDTKKENNLVVHIVKDLPKNITDTFNAVVDLMQRNRTSCNHTATHLLHQALRKILGTHVEQRGSMVHSSYLRFDFSHFSKLSEQELTEIEGFVNSRIDGQLDLEEHRNVPYHEAIKKAIALFGEKYGDVVRTIKFGQSVELCGGTHVKNTAQLWRFVITSETAVASGIRRIEAITFDAARDYYVSQARAMRDLKQLLKGADPLKTMAALQRENAEQKKNIEKLVREKQHQIKQELEKQLQEVNRIQFLTRKVDLDPAQVKDLMFSMGRDRKALFLVFASESQGKAVLFCYISKELVSIKNYNATAVVNELGQYIKGSGGGQDFFATAGGTFPEGIDAALQKAKDYIEKN